MSRFLDLAAPDTDLLVTAAALHPTGLTLVLDAGDGDSYTSGQTWADLSGNGYDFLLGTTSGVDSTDPTFTDDDLASYFTYNGAAFQRHTYDSANETWMQNLHKDNAKFSCCAWVYPVANTFFRFIWGTSDATTGAAFGVGSGTPPNLQYRVLNAGAQVLTVSSSLTIPNDAWSFVGMAIDESIGTNGLLLFCNGLEATTTATYSSPASGNATRTLAVGSRGTTANPWNGRISGLVMWDGEALTSAEFSSIYNQTRGRFYPDTGQTSPMDML